MDDIPRPAARSLSTIAALVTLACLSMLGCANPVAQGWADFKAKREIDEAAADDSFPNAAEVGLAATPAPGKVE